MCIHTALEEGYSALVSCPVVSDVSGSTISDSAQRSLSSFPTLPEILLNSILLKFLYTFEILYYPIVLYYPNVCPMLQISGIPPATSELAHSCTISQIVL